MSADHDCEVRGSNSFGYMTTHDRAAVSTLEAPFGVNRAYQGESMRFPKGTR
jgi:hypothetical protein